LTFFAILRIIVICSAFSQDVIFELKTAMKGGFGSCPEEEVHSQNDRLERAMAAARLLDGKTMSWQKVPLWPSVRQPC
jgi:hypothetical protein